VAVSPSLAVDGVEHLLADLALNPHQSKEVSLRGLMKTADVQGAVTGSLTLGYSGLPHALQPLLLLANKDTGFVLLPEFNGRHAQQTVAGARATSVFPDIP
jgi:hypothetical protein